MVENQIRSVVRHLKSKHVKITERNEWLLGCCEWFNSNNPQSTDVELQEFVYAQWLLADLRDIAESSLPENIADIPKTSINEKITLQVDSVLDVAESCYSQLLKIRNVNTSNIEVTETKPQDWEPKKKRMLKLTCTDGVQTIYGMEYKFIPSLREPLLPGFKVLITGPVECRRGVLLLEPHNIQYLGGEVDSIMVKNALENLLARALNVPENPNPFNPAELQNHMANMNVNNDEEENDGVNPTVQVQANEADNLGAFLDNDDIFLSEHLTQMENLFRAGTLQSNNSDVPISSTDSNPGSSSSHQSNSFPISTSTFQSYSTRETNLPSSSSNLSTVLGNSATSNGKQVGVAHPIISPNNCSKRPAPSPMQPDLKMARITSDNPPKTFQTFNESIGSSGFSSSTSTANFKIRDLKQLVNSNSAVRRCNASFLRITSKPKIREEIWQFSGEITDETGTLDVAFSDPFLEKMFEFSAVEILSQKERMKDNPDIKERINTILRRGVQKITSLRGEFHIHFSSSATLPKVINVIE